MNSDLQDFLDRHKAFWEREDLGRPLLNFIGYTPMVVPLADGSTPLEDFYLTPDMLTPEKIHPTREYIQFTYSWPYSIFHTCEGGPARQEDVFLPIQPYFKVPWMEAIIGCRVRVSPKANTMWSEPKWGSDWYNMEKVEVPIDERWLKKLVDLVKWCADKFFPSYLISNTLMRGPIDMFKSLVGIKNLCIALYKQPKKSRELLDILAEVTIEVMKKQLEVTPSYYGGYCNQYGIWSPGEYVYLQTDASHAISPKMYGELLKPVHERIAGEFEYSVLHLHSDPLYEKEPAFAEIVANEENVRSVEVSVDPPPYSGPLVTDLLPLLSIIHEKKPLIVKGQFTVKELDSIVEALPSGGLHISSYYRPIELRGVIT